MSYWKMSKTVQKRHYFAQLYSIFVKFSKLHNVKRAWHYATFLDISLNFLKVAAKWHVTSAKFSAVLENFDPILPQRLSFLSS